MSTMGPKTKLLEVDSGPKDQRFEATLPAAGLFVEP